MRYRAALPAAAALLLVAAERRAPGTTCGSVTGASSGESSALFSPKVGPSPLQLRADRGKAAQSLPSSENWEHPLSLPGKHAEQTRCAGTQAGFRVLDSPAGCETPGSVCHPAGGGSHFCPCRCTRPQYSSAPCSADAPTPATTPSPATPGCRIRSVDIPHPELISVCWQGPHKLPDLQ